MNAVEKRKFIWLAVILFAVPGSLLAQQQAPSAQPKRTVEMRTEVGVVSGWDLDFPPEAIAVMELGMSYRVIKDRPFQADLIVETDRKLADGNSMHRKSTAILNRDHNGRLREERNIERPGKEGEEPLVRTTISIRDFENRIQYILNPEMKAGFRVQEPDAIVRETDSRPTTPWTPHSGETFTSEVLGFQMIEGLQCKGTQDTVTIPAGEAGNAFPIEMVTERWYSDELQINLVVKHRDPRNGETTIRLTNLSREEPPGSLFEIPPDYEIREGQTTAIPLVQKDKP